MKKIDFIIKISNVQKNILVIKEMFASKGYEKLSEYDFTFVPKKDETINQVIKIEVEKIINKLECKNKSLLSEELISDLQGNSNLYQILKTTETLGVIFDED